LPGVSQRVKALSEKLKIYLLTADTFGSAAKIAEELEIELFRVSPEQGGEDKRDFVQTLEPAKTAAIGNGYNDHMMLGEAALGIAVLGREGCSTLALKRSDIVVSNIEDALDLLLNPLRIVATLRA